MRSKLQIMQTFAATIFTVITSLMLAGVAQGAAAHEIRPAIIKMKILPPSKEAQGHYEMAITINAEAVIAGISSDLKNTDDSAAAGTYNELRELTSAALEQKFREFAPKWLDAIDLRFGDVRSRPKLTAVRSPETGEVALVRVSTIMLAGDIPAGAETMQWTYPKQYGSNILRVTRPGDKKPFSTWLTAGKTSDPISLVGQNDKSTAAFFWDYIQLGFTHILPKGLDHILFVLGLYLLSTHLRPLLWQVTAFTLAHSITLALGVYGVVSVPPTIVEPLIALSIVYVAVENILVTGLSPWRPVVVFLFGLLHGLGFAGVITEIGLPQSQFITGLVGFNLGVELGQLAVIVLAFLATGLWWRTKDWYRSRIVIPGSLAIAAVGLYWSIERIFWV